jgi:hypothetical protein
MSGPQDPRQQGYADSANSFANPINPAYLNPGWGMDPNLMTPSYAAPFRPQFQGSSAYAAYARPTWAGGVGQILSPMFRDPAWGNPVDNNSAAVDSVAGGPVHSAAWMAQRIALPVILVGGAQRFLGPGGKGIGEVLGNTMLGRGIGGSIGRGIGAGLGRGVGGILGSTAGGIGAGVGGAMGGLFGAAVIPFAAGLAATHVADDVLVQPYVNAARTSRDLRDSFRGVTFGDGPGNSISGRGLGGLQSSRMGNEISRQGIKDMTFSASEYQEISSMGMRSGLFDDVASKGITTRVKSMADQIKLVMAISRDPSVQNAIEELGKLRMAGASVKGGFQSQAASTYRQIGMAASMAGTSVQSLMAQSGAQGQMMYQMSGMTPYLGALAAANSYAGFKNAERYGALSTAQLSRMGGAEGAAQSSLGGQIALANTPFARMNAMNKYMFGGVGSGGVVDTLSGFGKHASGDMLSTQGAMLLYGKQMAGQYIQEMGPKGLLEGAAKHLTAMGIRPNGRGGKYTSEQLASGLQSSGLDESQIQAILAEDHSMSSPGARAGKLQGLRAQLAEQSRQLVNQEGLQGGIVGLGKSAQRAYKGFKAAAAGPAFALNSAGGKLLDATGSATDWLMHGNSVGKLSDEERTLSDKFSLESSPESRGMTLTGGKYVADVKGFDKSVFEKQSKGAWSNMFKSGAPGKDADFLGTLLADASNPNSGNYDSFRTISKAGGDFKSEASRKALYDILKGSGSPAAKAMLENISADPEGHLGKVSGMLRGGFTKEISVDKGGMTNLSHQLLRATALPAELSSADHLNLMGQAQAYTQELEKRGEGSELISDDLLKKYPELQAMMKKTGNSNLPSELARKALSSGFSGTSHLVSKFLQDPNSMPEAFRKRFQAAQNKGPAGKAEMESIAVQAAASANGGLYNEKYNGAAGASRSDLAAQIKSVAETADASARASAGSVADSSGMDAAKRFDDGAATFGGHVERFGKYVEALTGKKAENSSGDSWYSPVVDAAGSALSWTNRNSKSNSGGR